MSRTRLLLSALVLAGALARPAAAIDQPTVDKLVAQVDERQRNVGDYRSVVYIERKERNKNDVVFEASVYRRDASDKFVILFEKPKEEAGKGYLRVDKNLFLYDPTVGKWERRTERERIAGTDSRRNDFDESRLHEEYDAAFVEDGKLGQFPVHHLKLSAKAGVDVAFPVIELWLDQASGNVLKRQELAASGRLMRTTYYPKWNKIFSAAKKADVYVPGEIRIFDEVEKGNATTVVFRKVDLDALDDSIFTKAWLEARSR
jgi:hypothetical protein